ncbi:MAG: hypothetical protein Harvfovirus2_23 [Harvfovirus sp.]|uniref:Uncharacterized protein n=1 Tax=Harvfovirus sp. TaxID=2487768 RepID=A0A3G5A3T6_9VIRU|nr:MAG: hypothetical protein Harvfovirus2_23 [Harvfovirus sp.]
MGNDPMKAYNAGKESFSNKNYHDAFLGFKAGSDLNHPPSIHMLGILHLNGLHIAKDEKEAENHFMKAHKLYHTESTFELGKLLLKTDHKEGMKYIKEAADKGEPGALALFGKILLNGLYAVEKDEKEAKKKFIEAYAKGDPTAAYELGILSEFENVDTAVKYLKEASAKGLAKASLKLANLFCQEKLVPLSIKDAKLYAELALKQGDTDAAFLLGLIHHHSGPDYDLKKSVEYYMIAAEGGNSQAQHQMGDFYEHGYDFLLRNEKKAFDYYYRAALLNDSKSILLVAEMLFSGTGIEKNISKAFEFHLKAYKAKETDYFDLNLKYSRIPLFQEKLCTMYLQEVIEKQSTGAEFIRKTASASREILTKVLLTKIISEPHPGLSPPSLIAVAAATGFIPYI